MKILGKYFLMIDWFKEEQVNSKRSKLLNIIADVYNIILLMYISLNLQMYILGSINKGTSQRPLPNYRNHLVKDDFNWHLPLHLKTY